MKPESNKGVQRPGASDGGAGLTEVEGNEEGTRGRKMYQVSSAVRDRTPKAAEVSVN